MSLENGRYKAAVPFRAADGWRAERVTPASRLAGANGMRVGRDGRIYVASVAGSMISAVDVTTGAIEAFSPMGGGIVAPDDLAFDDAGNLYATEITEGRVSVRAPNGTTRVLQGDIPVANPITFHKGRLFVGECRPGGRIMELDLNGGAPRVILEDVPMPNAFEVGADGKLYAPIMMANEIWRIDLESGAHETVAKDLGMPDSVKFDSKGRIVSTQVMSGQVLRIDPRTGDREVLADIGAGLDNVCFIGDRIFVSSIRGSINEVFGGGKYKPLVPDGLMGPFGLAMGADGVLFVADGSFTYAVGAGGKLELLGMLFSPGFPGYTRGVIATGPGEYVVATANGEVARWWPAKQQKEDLGAGLDQPCGVAILTSGAVAVAERAKGRVVSVAAGKVEELVSGLRDPRDVAVGTDGTLYVSETGGGRVATVSGGKVETVVDGLKMPHGIAIHGGSLYIADVGTKELIAYDLGKKTRRVIASNLPIGSPPGIAPNDLKAIPPLAGAMCAFTGIVAGTDGTIYVSGDTEGSVLAIRPA